MNITSMKCEKCGSERITFYRQLRSDNVWVVTARCDNMHIPNMKKIFYPVADFKISKLPQWPIPKAPKPQRQLSMLEQIVEDAKKEYKPQQPYTNFPFPVRNDDNQS